MTRQLKSIEAYSSKNYLINVMLCLSNFKVLAVIFMLCACNIIQHKINFMLYIFSFIVQVIILLGTFNYLDKTIKCTHTANEIYKSCCTLCTL